MSAPALASRRGRSGVRAFAAALVLILMVSARSAEAVSLRDIIELSRAGLADEVLIALIETDGTVFSLTPQQLVELKDKGVSEKVVVAMLWQGRRPLPEPSAPPAAAPAAAPVHDAAWSPDPPAFERDRPITQAAPVVVVVPTPVPIPYFVPVRSAACVRTHVTTPAFTTTAQSGVGRFINNGFRDSTPIGVWGPVTSTCLPK